MSTIKRKIAILGGTFNPVHCGHLIMADQALHQFDLEEVLWLPAGDPPHKPLAPGATSQDRLDMVKLAIADHPRFTWTDMEMRRQGHSYAIETLELLTQQQPGTEWYWVIGADALKDLPSWYRAEELVQLCIWIVAPRVGLQTAEDIVQEVKYQLPLRALILKAPYIEISSTFLRDQVHEQGSIRYLVHPSVERYIWDHRLYQ